MHNTQFKIFYIENKTVGKEFLRNKKIFKANTNTQVREKIHALHRNSSHIKRTNTRDNNALVTYAILFIVRFTDDTVTRWLN